jgi:hypothetical protein
LLTQVERGSRVIYLKIDQRRPLTNVDTEFQTLGCRHSTPAICKNNMTPNKCAFARVDNICLLVPRSWSKIFRELKKAEILEGSRSELLEKSI